MRRLGVFGCLILLAACSGSGSGESSTPTTAVDSDRDTLVERFEAARLAWDDAGISDYRITYVSLAPWDYHQPITAHVENGELIRTEIDPEADAIPSAVPRYSVESLFSLLDKAIGEQAYRISAEFDPLGYPLLVHIDWVEDFTDDELGAEVVGFEAGT